MDLKVISEGPGQPPGSSAQRAALSQEGSRRHIAGTYSAFTTPGMETDVTAAAHGHRYGGALRVLEGKPLCLAWRQGNCSSCHLGNGVFIPSPGTEAEFLLPDSEAPVSTLSPRLHEGAGISSELS